MSEQRLEDLQALKEKRKRQIEAQRKKIEQLRKTRQKQPSDETGDHTEEGAAGYQPKPAKNYHDILKEVLQLDVLCRAIEQVVQMVDPSCPQLLGPCQMASTVIFPRDSISSVFAVHSSALAETDHIDAESARYGLHL